MQPRHGPSSVNAISDTPFVAVMILLWCVLQPTSGLDSHTSLHLVAVLHQLSRRENRTVVLSIHQPRSEVPVYLCCVYHCTVVFAAVVNVTQFLSLHVPFV